jgi:chromosome segregation ATPase
MFKIMKWGFIGAAVLLLGGGLFFGRDLFSYAHSSSKMLKTAVKDSIPVQFEIQRARDLLEDLIPEMHANLRLVAQEEVEVASLEKEVGKERDWVASERGQIQKMRETLTSLPSQSAGLEVARQDQLEGLSQRFERFRTSELLLTGKEKLLQNRRRSLQAAIQRLEKSRVARVELASQIEALEGQFRLIQAQGSSSDLQLSDTKLAQTQRLLSDVKKRLEVAQRVLERESTFNDPAPPSNITAEGLAQDIDNHFRKMTSGEKASPQPVAEASRSPEATR